MNIKKVLGELKTTAVEYTEKAVDKASEMVETTYDSTTQGAGNIFDSASRAVSKTIDHASHVLGNENAQEAFIDTFDANKDGKVTASEIKKQMDSDKDGFVSAKELESMAIKGRGSELDKTTIKVLGAAAASADPNLTLFSKSDAGWDESDPLAKLRAQDTNVLPFNKKALASRDLNEVKVSKQGVFRVQDQVGNSCGTTSLSMCLKYFQGHTLENSVPTIDKYIRANGDFEVGIPGVGIKSFKLDGYTAPRDIVNYSKNHGMRAGMKNNSSLSDLKAMVDKGVPCLCLTDWNFEEGYSNPKGGDPDAESLHWVNVIGYEKNAEGKTDIIVANPHGLIQRIDQDDFNKVWTGSGPGLEQKVPKVGNIDTGMKRLFIAMVPQDDDFPVIAPDGTKRDAGDITIPTGNDGFRGKLAKLGSDAMHWAADMQEDVASRSIQAASEVAKGYADDGVLGALKNLWEGDTSQASKIKNSALKADIPGRAKIVNQLLNKGINRDYIQDTVYDILRETDWKDFGKLMSHIDSRKLASRLESDNQAGRVMAWIAKAEVDSTGSTGPKFEAFAKYLSYEHRQDAILKFLDNKYTKDNKLLTKVSSGLIRNMITDLMNGQTSGSEETTIYRLFKDASWSQFDKIMSRLNMNRVASELESSSELGNLLAWSIENGMKTDHWTNVSEIVSYLEGLDQYTWADDVIGKALTHSTIKKDLGKIPSKLRSRMKTLVDDISRIRTDKAVQAHNALKKL